MSQQELLKKVVQTLNRIQVDYMITGSLASSYQGEPRSTHDIDMVVNLPKSATSHLLTAFPQPNYYLDQESILEICDLLNRIKNEAEII